MSYRINPKSLALPLSLGLGAWLVSGNFSLGVAVFSVLIMPVLIGIYIPYAKDNPKHLWFKRKLYGWGWVPVTREGWLVTFGYVGLAALFGMTIDEGSSLREVMFTFVLPVTLLTITFMRIAYKKGEKPHWQWGSGKKQKPPR